MYFHRIYVYKDIHIVILTLVLGWSGKYTVTMYDDLKHRRYLFYPFPVIN